MDSGPEFAGRALDAWAYAHQVQLHFIDPGKPVQNAYIESSNGRLHNECLNDRRFTSLPAAGSIVLARRGVYSAIRPHSALGNRTRGEFAQQVDMKNTGRTLGIPGPNSVGRLITCGRVLSPFVPAEVGDCGAG